ncbi:GNAT family N-acetyltransferase [Paludicola sp. MB14-C6]|uniref:GNAT family N-acetyltransferase n=1 Tax=Paludihabitans sp. MB14-C6 TaxID=3070656 RepID=UPI0027DE66CD|nr:GNAT family N-acetyltransferase [Paludicola sp. MB14-C6]WMJ23742.1 GNAT family N-acetyltransferase [Paludicola sp. MB14-C6]
MERLHLHIPTVQELWYREHILSDADTMSYNKGYQLEFLGYNNDSGCISFPKTQWKDWYNWFVCGVPDRFYSYIVRNEDNAFIGDVNIHKSNNDDCYEMGIVIESKYRGMGYANEALKLLLEQAFEVFNAKAVHNNFEISREAAIKAHLSAGFLVNREENGIIDLVISRAQYDLFNSQNQCN